MGMDVHTYRLIWCFGLHALMVVASFRCNYFHGVIEKSIQIMRMMETQ